MQIFLPYSIHHYETNTQNSWLQQLLQLVNLYANFRQKFLHSPQFSNIFNFLLFTRTYSKYTNFFFAFAPGTGLGVCFVRWIFMTVYCLLQGWGIFCCFWRWMMVIWRWSAGEDTMQLGVPDSRWMASHYRVRLGALPARKHPFKSFKQLALRFE